MEKVLISGGTGLLGKAMSRLLLAKGFHVTVLSRHEPGTKHRIPGLNYALWDIARQQIDEEAVKQSDHIIHLAGAGVMEHKWTTAYKKQIIDSRTKSSELIISVLKKFPGKTRSFSSASAVGWYGPDKDPVVPFVETDESYNNFLGDTCRLWEASVDPVTELGIRLVKFRIGIVLGNEGGALAEFKGPLKFRVAPVMGNGRQVMSWIHIEDLCRMFIASLENEALSGVYNAVATEPVTNKKFMHKLAKKEKGWFIPVPVPAFALRLLLGGRSIEILKSATVSNKKILDAGFNFSFPGIDAALDELCKKH